MSHGALQPQMTWAEDRALQRCNPSAVPGVGVQTGSDHRVRPGHHHAAHQHDRAKPEWHDATLSPAGRPLPLANANRCQFQFTLNQDTDRLSDGARTNEVVRQIEASQPRSNSDLARPLKTPSDDIDDINARVDALSPSERMRLRFSDLMVRLFGRLNSTFGKNSLAIQVQGEIMAPEVLVIRYLKQLERGSGLARDRAGEQQLQESFHKMNFPQRFCFRMWAKHQFNSASMETGIDPKDVPEALFP